MKYKYKYYVARLNLIAPYNDKLEYIKTSLSKNVYVDSRKKSHKYGVFELNELVVEERHFITGMLAKFLPTEDEEKANTEKGTIDIFEDRNNLTAKSPFFLDVKTGIIIFRPSGNAITINSFNTSLSNIIEKANDYFMINVDIQMLSEEKDILRYLNKFIRITEIKVSLHPSNPSNRAKWKDVDEDLQKLDIESYTGLYKSEKGIKTPEDSKTYAEISMAADGYGRADIKGETSEGKEVASTNKVPVQFEVEEESISNKSHRSLSTSVLIKFKEIWNRMEN